MAIKLGAAIKLCRVQRSMTQAELAHRANLSESYVSLLEQGRRDPTLSSVEAIAQALDVPVSLLIFLAADPSELDSLSAEVKDKLSTAVLALLKASTSDRQPPLI